MSNRRRYTTQDQAIVRRKYPLCTTLEEKEALAKELKIDSIHKLYNLASQLRVMESYQAEQEALAKEEARKSQKAISDQITHERSNKTRELLRKKNVSAPLNRKRQTGEYFDDHQLGLELSVCLADIMAS